MREISIKESVFDGLMSLLESKNGVDLSGFYEDTDKKESVAIALLLLNKRNAKIKPRVFISDMNSNNVTVAILVGESLLTGERAYVKIRFNFVFSEEKETEISNRLYEDNNEIAIYSEVGSYSKENQQRYGGVNYGEMHAYVAEHIKETYDEILQALTEHGNKTYWKNFVDNYHEFPELENLKTFSIASLPLVSHILWHWWFFNKYVVSITVCVIYINIYNLYCDEILSRLSQSRNKMKLYIEEVYEGNNYSYKLCLVPKNGDEKFIKFSTFMSKLNSSRRLKQYTKETDYGFLVMMGGINKNGSETEIFFSIIDKDTKECEIIVDTYFP